jgi:hypothetical protein
MNARLIADVRLSFELAEVEAIARDYRAGFESYTAIVWKYGSSGLRACRAFPHKYHPLPL